MRETTKDYAVNVRIGEGVGVDRESTAWDDMRQRLDAMQKWAESIASRAEEKFAPVCNTDTSSPAPSVPIRDYPPLFDFIRSRLMDIEESLMRIDRLIDRAEL